MSNVPYWRDNPPAYFPVRHGRYEVTPGLFPLGTDFGGGETDKRVFAFDNTFPKYHANKMTCRQERFDKYVCTDEGFTPEVQKAFAAWMVHTLTGEWTKRLYPFHLLCVGSDNIVECELTGEDLVLDHDLALNFQQSNSDVDPRYISAFDALCCQVPEDIAVTVRYPDGTDKLVALHLCAPSRWAAEEKIGKPFVAVHEPVAHFERIARASGPMLDTISTGKPRVRWAWSLSFDGRLNDHPEPPPDNPRKEWNPQTGPLFLRTERQTLWGLPEVNAFVFTIRVYLRSVEEVTPNERSELAQALRSMSQESREYKGLTRHFDAVLARLSAVFP